MATMNEPITILLVSKNQSIIESTRTVLANESTLLLSEEDHFRDTF